MLSSETAISREMSRGSNFLLSNPSSNSNQSSFKHVSAAGEFLKSRDFMGSSDFFLSQNLNQAAPTEEQQQNSGLSRYRSAPSSFFATLLDSTPDNSSSGDDESGAIFSAFMNGHRDLNQKNSQYAAKQEVGVDSEPRPGQRNGFSNGQVGYEAAVNVGGGSIVGSYSVGMENHVQMRNGTGNLLRQSSSPAGFLNGFNVMGEVGNYRVQEGNSSAAGLTNHISFSSAPSSSLRFMPTIPENGNESIGTRSPGNVQLRNGKEAAGFHQDSWNESPFSSLKRNRDGDLKIFSDFSVMENQNVESRKSSGLVHHLSLPKTSSEMAAAEKFLQFQQDYIPCQIRAKRGCATHPRSIAERNRRNRISEKMKKLQDLFPSLDKQTNTSDMLDLAVEHIKDLQKQVQTLKDIRAKCVCPNKP